MKFDCFQLSRVILVLILISAADGNADAENLSNWRFFTSADGLGESWSIFVSSAPSGNVWVSHGDIDQLSYLDGMAGSDGKMAHTIISPGAELKVLESSTGDLWSLFAKGIQKYENGRWVKREIKGIDVPYHLDLKRNLIPFLPLGKDEIIYLLPDSIMKYDFARQMTTTVLRSSDTGLMVFSNMCASDFGWFWITGNKGIGKLFLSPLDSVVDWYQYISPMKELSDFDDPMEIDTGELFVLGTTKATGGKKLLSFDGDRWREVGIDTRGLLKCWPGLDGSYWIWREKNVLSKMRNGKEEEQVRAGVLSGNYHDVSVERGDVFWLATSHGLARHAPSLWRTPPEAADFKAVIHAIHEDDRGRLWFGAVYQLLLLKPDGQWKRYPLPGNLTTQLACTQAICSLPDGRIAIGTAPYDKYLLVFDPELEQFDSVDYVASGPDVADQVRIGLIAPREKGGIWVQTLAKSDTLESYLQIFDGKVFKPFLNLTRDAVIKSPRYIFDNGNGALWLGGTHKLDCVLLRDGRILQLPADERTGLNGAYSFLGMEDGRCWIGGRDKIVETDGSNWTIVRSGMDIIRYMLKSRDGDIWVASRTGIHRFVDGSWITNTTEDGLPSSVALTVFEDSRGRIWAGTTLGLSMYHPDADRDPPSTTIPAISNLKEVSPRGDVRFLFTGTDKWQYTRTERLLYSYRLDGEAWSPFVSSNVANFNNLSFGIHGFEVRAMDINLNVDPHPAKFEFSVLVPWYRQLAFLITATIGSIIVLLSVGYAVHRHFALESLVVERTKELYDTNILLVSEHEKLELSLKNEHVLAQIAARLNSTENFFSIIDELSKTICEAAKIDGLGLFSFDEGNGCGMAIGHWVEEHSSVRTMDLPVDRLPLLSHRIKSENAIRLPDLDGLEPPERALLADYGIASLQIIPLSNVDRKLGCIWFVRDRALQWKEEENDFLVTVSNVIANAWHRRELMQARMEADRKKTEAVKMAEAASRMASIGVMAGGITHEINQPLNTMRIISESALMDYEQDKIVSTPQEYIGMIRNLFTQVLRLDNIVKHMKDFWVSPASIQAEPFDPNEAVLGALSLLESQIKSHGIGLNLILDPKLPRIRGNRIHLEQIVINLLVNAIHALDEVSAEEKTITILSLKRNTRVVMEVIDNGSGFAPGHEEKIFDAFYSTKEPGQGTGLGLAIVQKFVEGLKGTIQARNGQQGGAIFTLEFPSA